MLGRPFGEREGGIVGRAELDPIAIGPVEVVADELVRLDQLVGVRASARRREALVQLRAHRLRQPVVRRVPDQEMTEPERLVVDDDGPLWSEEVLADEGDEPSVDIGSPRARAPRRRRDGRSGPRPSRARGRYARRCRAGRAGRPAERGSSAARRRPPGPARRASPPFLLTKSGLPAAESRIRSRSPASISSASSSASISSRDSSGASGSRKDVRRVQLATAPGWTALEQFGPRQAKEEDRRVAAQVGHVLDQVEKGGLSPSGCRRRRAPPAARRRAPPPACETPTRSRRRSRRRTRRRGSSRVRHRRRLRRGEAASRPR